MKLVSPHCLYCDEPVFATDDPKPVGHERGYKDWAHGECQTACDASLAASHALQSPLWADDNELRNVT
jgi:hypothetical protein